MLPNPTINFICTGFYYRQTNIIKTFSIVTDDIIAFSFCYGFSDPLTLG